MRRSDTHLPSPLLSTADSLQTYLLPLAPPSPLLCAPFSLRARTKHNPYQKRLDAEHVHAFDPPEVLDNGKSVKACAECGFQIEIELL